MGKPNRGNALLLINEYIVDGERTLGIETSKYQEEKKTKVIPLVAASEKGRGQTSFELG